MNISHNFIIYYIDNVAYLYNYETKEEFEINKNYLRVLNNYTEETDTENSSDSEILEVLKENGMIKEDIDKPFVYLHYFSNIFHKISKDSSLTTLDSEEEWARQYLEVCKLTMDSAPIPVKDSHKDFAYVVDLPNPDVETYNVSLTDCLKKRKTIREFYDFKMPQQKLSDILYQSFGHMHGEEKEYLPFIRRSSPSGGCLQIVEPYVCVFNVESMENGVYYYDSYSHKLCLVNSDFSYFNLRECLAGQFFANNCSVGIFLVANLEILAWKYKTPRNYRVIFLEAGHFSQTLQLVATSKDVNTWITGAFNDTIIEKTCRLDGVKKIPTFFVGLGRGEYRSMHSIMAKKLKECVGDDKV